MVSIGKGSPSRSILLLLLIRMWISWIGFSLSLTLVDAHFIRYIVTRKGATPWQSLRSLSALVSEVNALK